MEPTVETVAFNCAHCGTLATQTWFTTYAHRLNKSSVPPIFNSREAAEKPAPDGLSIEGAKAVRENWLRMATGEIYGYGSGEAVYDAIWIINLSVSQCFSCDAFSVWHHDRLVWPAHHSEVVPASDMPADVLKEFDEAAAIVNQSPRGAAALLRLAIQKLCVHLGGTGKNINSDIASLVQRGLDPRVQQALDVVRVVGNNAVHPGELDISDDKPAALQLFALLNLIVEIMITQPAHIAQLYESLPPGAIAAIQRRDQQA